MPISASNVQFYKANVNDDSAANGGHISATLVVDGVKNNIFPDASKSERTAGSTKYRKVFLSLRNPDDTKAIDVKLYVMRPTQANDAVLMVECDKDATQADITPSTKRYGAGALVSAAAALSTTLTVLPEQSVHSIYRVGDTIAITTRNETAPTAVIEYYTLTAVADSGANKLLTLDRGLKTAMPVGAIVTSCVFIPEFGAAVGSTAAALTTGSFDFSAIKPNHAGCIEDVFTISINTTTSEFTMTSIKHGLTTWSGNVASDFSPFNPENNQPFFTIPAGSFSGTLTANDVISFATTAADYPVFLERIIPADTEYNAGNSVLLGVELESA